MSERPDRLARNEAMFRSVNDVEALILLKLEVNPGEAGVVCTFAQEWNRLPGADLIVDDVAKAVVGIVEAILVLSAAFRSIGHDRRARPVREIPETQDARASSVRP